MFIFARQSSKKLGSKLALKLREDFNLSYKLKNETVWVESKTNFKVASKDKNDE